jgi:hypothetical protein
MKPTRHNKFYRDKHKRISENKQEIIPPIVITLPPHSRQSFIWGPLIAGFSVLIVTSVLFISCGSVRTLQTSGNATKTPIILAFQDSTPTLPPITATTGPSFVLPTPIPSTPIPSIQLPFQPPAPNFCYKQATPEPNCFSCPYRFSTQQYTKDQVMAALTNASKKYHISRNLLISIAELESGFDPMIYSCSYDIGLMQIKYGYWQSIDLLNVPICGLSPTPYDPYTLEGNAMIGAKLIAWISCFFTYWGGTGVSIDNPGKGTSAWYYHQANLAFPDIKNLDGSPNSQSLCLEQYNSRREFRALTTTPDQFWSCPFIAKTGDSTLLDVVASTYNQGMGTTVQNGIQNQWYVNIFIEHLRYVGSQYPPE